MKYEMLYLEIITIQNFQVMVISGDRHYQNMYV